MTLPPEQITKFGVIAEVVGKDKKIIQLNMTFGRLIDEIVVPYDQGQPFFVDGVPVSKEKLDRIKIVKQTESFEQMFSYFSDDLNRGDTQSKKMFGDQY